MPSYRIEVRHHRQRHWIERRFPTFTGYLFVNIGPHDYRAVEEADGVSKILRFTKRYEERQMPFEFAQETIDRLRYIQLEQEQNFLFARARRRREEEIELQQPIRGSEVIPILAGFAGRSSLSWGGFSSSLSSPSSGAFITETLNALGNLV